MNDAGEKLGLVLMVIFEILMILAIVAGRGGVRFVSDSQEAGG